MEKELEKQNQFEDENGKRIIPDITANGDVTDIILGVKSNKVVENTFNE